MSVISLPGSDGQLIAYQAGTIAPVAAQANVKFNRRALAAAHIVANPLADIDPFNDAAIDWEATLAYRERLFDLGLGIAEAMDTAQRGMGMDWPVALELITKTMKLAEGRPNAVVASGAGTDDLPSGAVYSIEQITAAYEAQCEAVEATGSRIILMASRALAANARSPQDYQDVYTKILSQVREPVILHWLGDMFDPALKGYWGSEDLDQAMAACLEIIKANSAKIDGIKISLLDKDKEVFMRRRLPEGVSMYTGDDFNYPDLIKGDEQGYSDALLGIFDPIAPAANAALSALASGDMAAYDSIFTPTVELSRHIFKAPTRFYKTGVVFMAYLNGFQNHFTMVGAQQSARSVVHLSKLFQLADKAGLLLDAEAATERMRAFLRPHGVEV